jgi:hypothetical protein
LETAGIALLDGAVVDWEAATPLPPINEAEASIMRARNVARTRIPIRMK